MEYKVKGLRVPVYKHVPTASGYGHTSVPDGTLVGDIVVEIDWDAIVQHMGHRALKAKSHTCRDGFVVVKARNVKREAP